MEFPDSLIEIRKRDLRRFFADLREQEHYMYAILTKSPQSVFRIVKDSDDWNEPETAFSIKEFLATLGSFHCKKDTFCCYFSLYYFRDEWNEYIPDEEPIENAFNGEAKEEWIYLEDMHLETFMLAFPHILAYICRNAVLANAPFRLDKETIKQYGFTREDVKRLREPLTRCNERIIAELRAEYDRLAAIDCLHEVAKKKPEPKKEKPVTPRQPRPRIRRKTFVSTKK